MTLLSTSKINFYAHYIFALYYIMSSIIILVVLCVFVAFVVLYDRSVFRKPIVDEKFKVLKGIRSSLVTYDDASLFDPHPDYLAQYNDASAKIPCAIDFPIPEPYKDEFIVVEGRHVRKRLLPSNYADDNSYGKVGVNKNKSKAAVRTHMAPQAYNYYF